MTSGGKREGAGRKRKYFDGTKDVTLTWPPLAILKAKEEAEARGLTLSEHILIKLFGRRFHK